MGKDDTANRGLSEAELVGLLASLKVEPAPETNFEARFLYDLRDRLARESVCCPARRLLWDHILQMLNNFSARKLACGASTLGLGALAVGFFALPEEEAATVAVASAPRNPLSRLESSLHALRPSCGHDTEACTTIRICQQKQAPYTDASLASGHISPSFDYRPAAPASDAAPVNMGLDSHVQELFPSYTTVAGF